jgi:hypothetical protein
MHTRHTCISRLCDVGIACLRVPQIEVLEVERDPRLCQLFRSGVLGACVPQLENTRVCLQAVRPASRPTSTTPVRCRPTCKLANLRCTSRPTFVVLVGRLACVRAYMHIVEQRIQGAASCNTVRAAASYHPVCSAALLSRYPFRAHSHLPQHTYLLLNHNRLALRSL